ncbi:uncharacterized protein LOC132069478 [Lycium ferocissimum]|uniref:uncharacterized protein LOC132069478 n=1 Tax=Lycium ferocissimum TaxID=112874 RepID=UPI0028163011|nr:uncharacterized protein LOC132069478 [Lycium ferocissimum]
MTQMVDSDPNIELKQQSEIFVDKEANRSCNSKAKISLIGIRRQKNGRYAAVITDQIRHKKIWLGTFDTIEEASQAYFSKKSEFENEKLSKLGNKTSKRIHETARIDGVHKKNKRGKYNTEITNPITKKRIWLGTFGNAEDASQAYQSEKPELNAMQQQCTNKHTHSKQDGKSKKLVNVKQGRENVNCEIFQPESAGGSEIDIPISTSSNGGTDQRIDFHKIGTAQEAFRVNHSKRKQVLLRRHPKLKPVFLRRPPESLSQWLMDNKVCGAISSNECDTSTSCNPKARRSLIGIQRQKNGRYAARITDRIKHKEVWLGTFDTVEEASQAYFSKKSEFEKLSQGNKEKQLKKTCDQIQQPELPSVVEILNTASWGRRKKRTDSQGKEPGSSQETSCLMTNVHGTKSSDMCNTTTSCDPKAKRSLIGIRKLKSGRYGAVITDRIKHKEVWLGTFDTIEEASQAYFSKKSEFEKLSQQGNKDNKQKENLDQIQQPESSPVAASFSNMANHQTLDTASGSGRDNRIDSHKTKAHIIGAHKSKIAGKYRSRITNPITKKKISLGTFDTAEEASQAYHSKKLEFQKLVKAKQQQCSNEQTHSKIDGKSEKVVNVKQGDENVNCELESIGGSPEIAVLISNSSNGGTEQMVDFHKIVTAEEDSKKFDLQTSKKDELQSDMTTDSSVGEKQEGQEDDEDLWIGGWVQLPGNREVKFSLKLGLPIIDNYGYLLGELSSLDDLSIR